MTHIRLILMDVDGVLTDGKLIFGNQGEELKSFSIVDGLGIHLARQAGLKVGIITGRRSDIVSKRARELKMDVVMQGCFHKLPAYLEILKTFNLNDGQVCYIGDDLLDMDILSRAGLAVSPVNARPEIKAVSDFSTAERGGEGAVRKVIELILKQQGKWELAVAHCRLPSDETQNGSVS
ncbi:HAD-IIIA family hydrolase [bacterium]|nr:HAD-IIIA family hydrolase [bacterium]